ncbi:sensor histidine kinase [Roseibium aggregatum]|jgi:light-regulated signal transduction histidine kinase (bacteriophytochrome)|uniref:sensor histidine kinase n=1 Tax=Roseibium aggregatum TaxID=187304 RepID=UPI003A97010A
MTASDKHLREANEELQAFAYAASHDLRAPLKSISGQLQLLESLCSDALPQTAQTLMSNMHLSLDRMSLMIDGLLDYAQITNPEVHLETVDLHALTGSILDARNDDLTSIAAAVTNLTGGSIFTSSPLVQRILGSLVDNAIKYRRLDERLTLKIASKETEAGWSLSVEDNGIGIEEKYQDRIFGLMQRLHTQDEIAGNGLGLCLASKAARHLGGKIWLNSTPGFGSTFFVFLPKEGGNGRQASENNRSD